MMKYPSKYRAIDISLCIYIYINIIYIYILYTHVYKHTYNIYIFIYMYINTHIYIYIYTCMLTDRLPSSKMQRFWVSRDQSCFVTVHVTLHMKLVGRGGAGWGGVGHVNVRWNLDMALMLREEPSLELAHDVDATRWTFVRTCTWRSCYAMNLCWNLHMSLMLRDEPFVGTCTWRWCCGVLSHWWHRQLVEDDERSCAQFLGDNQGSQNQQKDLAVHKKFSVALGESDWSSQRHGQSAAELVTTQTTEQQKCQAEWHETKPWIFDEEILVSLRRNDHFYKNTRTVTGPAGCICIKYTYIYPPWTPTNHGHPPANCPHLKPSQGGEPSRWWCATVVLALYRFVYVAPLSVSESGRNAQRDVRLAKTVGIG